MNKKALSIIGVSCLGAVLFAGSMFGGNTAEAGLNDYGKVSEYSKMLADNYRSVNDYYIETLSVDGLSDNQKKEYLTRDDVYAVGNNIVISKEEVQQYTDFYLHDGESEANAHQLAVKDIVAEFRLHFLDFLETRARINNVAQIQSFLLPHWKWFVDYGSSGTRVWIAWDANFIDVAVIESGTQFMHCLINIHALHE